MKQKCVIKNCKQKSEGYIETHPFCVEHYRIYILIKKSKETIDKQFKKIKKEVERYEESHELFKKWEN